MVSDVPSIFEEHTEGIAVLSACFLRSQVDVGFQVALLLRSAPRRGIVKKIGVLIVLFVVLFSAALVFAQEGGEIPAFWEGHLLAGESRSYVIEVPQGVEIHFVQVSGEKLDGHPEHGCTDQPDEGEACDDDQIDEHVVASCNGVDFLDGPDQGREAEHWSQMSQVGPMQLHSGMNACSVYNPAGGNDPGSTNYRISILIRYTYPVTETPAPTTGPTTETPVPQTVTPEAPTATTIPPTETSGEPVSEPETAATPIQQSEPEVEFQVPAVQQSAPNPTPCPSCTGISCEFFKQDQVLQVDLGMGLLFVSAEYFDGAQDAGNGYWVLYTDYASLPDLEGSDVVRYVECTVSCAPRWATRRVDGSVEYLIGLGFTQEWTSILIQQTEGLSAAEADAKALRLFNQFYARRDLTTRYGWFRGNAS